MTIQLSPFNLQCRELLDASPKRHSRHCLRSAFHHLELAGSILHIDPAMAAFRGLTAEEEAASGLMHCLKERGYANSSLLNPRDHIQKNSITPFLDVVGLAVSEILKVNSLGPGFHIKDVQGERRLLLCLNAPNSNDLWIYPIPPLNFTITSDGKPVSYKKHIAKYVDHHSAKNVEAHLRNLANMRNRLLYAGPDGYPSSVDISDNFFESRTVRVLAMVRAYLLIEPYQELQPFVQDALDAFLAMLGKLSNHNLNDEV